MPNSELAMIDVRLAPLRLACDCGWVQPQDPGGPTLATLVERAQLHIRQAHQASLATRPKGLTPDGH